MEKDWGMVSFCGTIQGDHMLTDRPAGFDEPAAHQPEVQEIAEESDEARSLQGEEEDQTATEDR